MKILVIGGGVFIGRALVEETVRQGHEVTVFNRGRRNAVFPPGVTWIQGDRDGDLGPLGGGTWDAVIDVCAYFPRQVASLLRAVAGRSGCYLLVSSVAAYASMAAPGLDESSPLARPKGWGTTPSSRCTFPPATPLLRGFTGATAASHGLAACGIGPLRRPPATWRTGCRIRPRRQRSGSA